MGMKRKWTSVAYTLILFLSKVSQSRQNTQSYSKFDKDFMKQIFGEIFANISLVEI